MVVEELITKLGLDIDTGAFAKAEALQAALSKGFVAFGAAAAAALAVGAAALAKATANAADHAKKLAQSVGVDSIELQKLAYAAELSDVEIGTLAQGLGHLAKSGVKDVRGEILRLADQFKTLPNDGAKVALAMDKFGKSGRALIPFLNTGREDIERLMAEAEDLGIVFDETAQNEGEEFNDSLTTLSAAAKGLAYMLGKVLIPPLTRVIKALTQGVKAMRAFFNDTNRVSVALRMLGLVLASVGIAFVLLKAQAIAAGAASLVAAARTAVAWLAAAAPIVALVALIGLVLLVLDDLKVFFTGEGKSVIGSFFEYVYKEFGDFQTFFKEIGRWIFTTWAGVFESLVNYLGEKLGLGKDLIKGFGDYVRDNFDEIAAEVGQTLAGAIKTALMLAVPGGALLLAGANGAGAIASMFGGGASPAASASNSVSTVSKKQVNNQKNYVTIQGSPNPQETADAVTGSVDRWWNGQLIGAKMGIE